MKSERHYRRTIQPGAFDVTTEGDEEELRSQDLLSHRAVANAVDRVLDVWSNVGLATMMAEIRGAGVTEIVQILDELAAAGTRATNALLLATPDQSA
jgi:hypothetical protein